MKYGKTANAINIVFLALIAAGPLLAVVFVPQIPLDFGAGAIGLSAFLLVFVLADWYHFYVSNSLAGILVAIGGGIAMAVVSAGLVAAVNNLPFLDVVFLEYPDIWHRYALRMYGAGLGVASAGVVSIPRLVLIRWVSNDELPGQDEIFPESFD